MVTNGYSNNTKKLLIGFVFIQHFDVIVVVVVFIAVIFLVSINDDRETLTFKHIYWRLEIK